MPAAIDRASAVAFPLLSALVSLLVLAAAPATAASETVSDGTGDVVSMHRASNHPAPQATFADITQLVSMYRRHELVLRTTFRKLVDRPALLLYVGIDVESASGERFDGQLIYSSEHGITSRLLLGEHDLPRSCFDHALRSRVDRVTSTLTFVIPSRCLGHPAWVRTDSSSYVVAANGHRAWRDDARAPYREPDSGGIYATPTFGPDIYVG